MTAINLFDAGSNPIPSFTVSSDSGTTYPVPEPTGLLLLSAVAISAIRRRRRA